MKSMQPTARRGRKTWQSAFVRAVGNSEGTRLPARRTGCANGSPLIVIGVGPCCQTVM
jgi:hypothetical protein